LNAIQALYQLSYGPTGGLAQRVCVAAVERLIWGWGDGRKGRNAENCTKPDYFCTSFTKLLFFLENRAFRP
jgi:hypothetical protein